jgi:hypothetical protein
VPVVTPAGTVVLVPSQGQLADVALVDIATLPAAPVGVTFPVGVFSFRVENVAVGGSVDLAISTPVGVTSYWKLIGATWTQMPATPSAGGIVVTLVDGGLGDADGVANGVIVDPGGPSIEQVAPTTTPATTPVIVAPTSPPSTSPPSVVEPRGGLPATGGNPFGSLALGVVMAAAGAIILLLARRRLPT